MFSSIWNRVKLVWVSFEVKMGWLPETSVNGTLPDPIPQDGFRTVLAIAPKPGNTDLAQAALAQYDESSNQKAEKSVLSGLSASERAAFSTVQACIAKDPQALAALQEIVTRDHLDGGTASDGTSLLHNLQLLATEPLAPGVDRAGLLGAFIRQVDNPMDTYQGERNTCVPAVASMLMAQRYPAEEARLLVGLASPQGNVQLANGATLTRSPDWQASDGGRSQSEELLEPAFISYAVSDEGLTYDNKTDQLSDGGSGLSAVEANTLYQGLTDASYKEVDFYGARDPKAINQTIAQIAKDASADDPVPVGVNWVGNVGHKLLVEDISNDVVTYLNPYGMREQMSLADFSSRLENANLPTDTNA